MFNLKRLLPSWGRAEVRPLTRSVVWDAAGAGNRLASWAAPSTNWLTNLGSEALKQRARDEYRNNGWARRAIGLLVTDAVGAGIIPQFRGAGKQAAKDAWTRWTDEADASGRFDLYGLEQAALETALVDGEALVRLLPGPGASVPLRLQLLPGEFLDGSRVDARTLNGIEYDEHGRRVAYWLFEKHPAASVNVKSVRVPAEQICHIFRPVQPGVERGVTALAPALLPLRELREYCEAALVRQKVAALYAGFVQTSDGTNPLKPTDAVPSLEPGAVIKLKPGEIIEFSEPPDVGASFEPFLKAHLKLIAAAVGVPYELLANDLSGVTFASGRHALLAYKRVLECIQHHVIVFQLLRPVLAAWARLAVASGVLPGSPEEYSRVRWIAPVLAALDPGAETRAQVMRVRAGFTSRSEVIATDGWDADEIDREIAADNARADQLGNVYDSDPRRTAAQGQEQPSAAQAAQEQ